MLLIKLQRITSAHIFGIVGIGLILTIPLLFSGIFAAMDITFHLRWTKPFSEQFWNGDFYPRWLLNVNAGLGSPTFFFYAPIPYYFTSLFYPLFTSDPYGWSQLKLSAVLALIASGLTSYIWLKEIAKPNAAFLACLLYMALPYHLAIDLYWRFAFAEYWTFVWLPLILYFSIKIINGKRISIIGFAVSYALLIMTHLPTLIIFSLVPVSYVILMAGKHQRKRALIRLLIAMILGISLSCIYWLPAMTTQEYISMNVLKEGIYFYKNLFLFSSPPYPHSVKFWRYLEILTLTMGGLAGFAFIIARNSLMIALRRESSYWAWIALITCVMTLPVSKYLWQIFPVLQRIQFPWRFNTVLTVATTALLALAISELKQKDLSYLIKKLQIGIIVFISLLLSVIQIMPAQREAHFVWSYFAVVTIAALILGVSALRIPVNFVTQRNLVVGILLLASLLLSSGIVIKSAVNNPLPNVDVVLKSGTDTLEYRPKWVPPHMFESTVATASKLGKSFSITQVAEGQGSSLVQQWKPRKIILQTDATSEIWLTINQFYYSGWTARLGSGIQLPVKPSKPEGLLSLSVPTGKHEVVVTLDAGVEERTGQVISTIAAVIVLFLSCWFSQSDKNSLRCLV